jgi:hypothetical protein
MWPPQRARSSLPQHSFHPHASALANLRPPPPLRPLDQEYEDQKEKEDPRRCSKPRRRTRRRRRILTAARSLGAARTLAAAGGAPSRWAPSPNSLCPPPPTPSALPHLPLPPRPGHDQQLLIEVVLYSVDFPYKSQSSWTESDAASPGHDLQLVVCVTPSVLVNCVRWFRTLD